MAPPGTPKKNAINEGYKPHPSQVPISNFVSIKLSGETDYLLWKKQMMCLLEYHDMVGYIDGSIESPEWNKSGDTLVKGWIYGTLCQDVMSTVSDFVDAKKVRDDAKNVWEELKSTYDNSLKVLGSELYTDEDISNHADKHKATAKYIPLHRAIVSGDWDKAQEEFFNKDKATLTAKIGLDENETPLHIAVSTGQNLQFVENLLEEIISESLIPPDQGNNRFTELHSAAVVGNTKAAKMLVEKNSHLLFIPDDEDNLLPIHMAIINYHDKTFRYLFEVTKQHTIEGSSDSCKNPFKDKQYGPLLLSEIINQSYVDIAYELICEYPKLAKSKDLTKTPLMKIVANQDLYFSATQYNSYQRFIYSHVPTGKNISENDNMIIDVENPETCCTNFDTKCRSCFYPVIKRIYVNIWKATLLHVPHIKNLQKEKRKHKKAREIVERLCRKIGKIKNAAKIFNQYCAAFNNAVLNDNREAVEMIIRFFPSAIWTTNNGNYISQVVAKDRCEMVLNFLEDQARGGHNLFRSVPSDKEDNNILHLAGRLADLEKLEMVSGAALQMQREVRWFKRIEKCMLPSETEEKNKNGQTPIMVFREEHKHLREKGEEWMKKTSDSYTITAALIITIVFAAAITVPGGNDQNTGKPIYETNASFIIFAISDAISLFTSTTSLLLFLSILTARYHEDDFLYKLPKRLILGLVMLFVSVTSMMVAFGATLFIMFGQGRAWILIPIAVLACLPVASYVILQYPLLAELVSSTYGHGIYNKRNDRKNK